MAAAAPALVPIRRKAEVQWLKLRAYDKGYLDGKRNFHTTDANYKSSHEWLEYLAGWRVAQAQWHPYNRIPQKRDQMMLFEDASFQNAASVRKPALGEPQDPYLSGDKVTHPKKPSARSAKA